MSGQLSPANLEAERCVLGCMLISKETVGRVTGILEPEHFSDEAHREMYIVLCELANRETDATNGVGVLEELGSRMDLDKVGGTAYLAEMVECVPCAGYAPHYAEIVRDEWLKRRGTG